MIVVGAGPNHDVCLPLTDLTDDLFADIQRRQELAVMVVEHLVFDADAPAGFLRFRAAAPGKFFSPLSLVARIAVG